MSIYTFDYDTAFDPAFPVVEVELRGLGLDNGAMLTALVDSGADGTLVPLNILQQIGIAQSGWVRMKGIGGISRRIPVYLLQLSIGSLSIGTIRVGGDRLNEQMILGRNVLNQMIVTLNGLANIVEISQ